LFSLSVSQNTKSSQKQKKQKKEKKCEHLSSFSLIWSWRELIGIDHPPHPLSLSLSRSPILFTTRKLWCIPSLYSFLFLSVSLSQLEE
jgi:hypothetical protein